MNYFFSYQYITVTNILGFGNVVLTLDNPLKNEGDFNFVKQCLALHIEAETKRQIYKDSILITFWRPCEE